MFAKDPQKFTSLVGAEGAEIAHYHDDEVKAFIGTIFKVVPVDVVDFQALLSGGVGGVFNRTGGEIYACDIVGIFREA